MSDDRDAGEGGTGAPPDTHESNRAPDLTKRYEGDNITIYWHAKRCIHDAACIRAQPRVFNPRRRPWIDPSHATADSIAEAVRACPTGALQYEFHDGRREPADDCADILHVPNGPLYVRGNVVLTEEDGTVIRKCTRVALCQCGKSKNRPFCDNSHRAD